MRYIKYSFYFIVILVSCLISVELIENAIFQYDKVSLRYDEGISKNQVKDAKYSVQNQKENEKIIPTFWREDKGKVKTVFKEATATTLVYLGAGYQVHPTVFLSGGYPIEGDVNGCAISDTLAFSLFGSLDVIGLEFEYLEKPSTVRGVFKKDTNLALIAGDTDEKYTAIELDGDILGSALKTANMFIENSGIDEPNQRVHGSSIVSILKLIAIFPFIIGVFCILLCLLRFMKKRYLLSTKKLGFMILTIIVCILPLILELIPQWLLPTKWSDFSFWFSLLEMMITSIEEWFYLSPTIKDVFIKFSFLKISLLAFVQLILGFAIFSLVKKDLYKLRK